MNWMKQLIPPVMAQKAPKKPASWFAVEIGQPGGDLKVIVDKSDHESQHNHQPGHVDQLPVLEETGPVGGQLDPGPDLPAGFRDVGQQLLAAGHRKLEYEPQADGQDTGGQVEQVLGADDLDQSAHCQADDHRRDDAAGAHQAEEPLGLAGSKDVVGQCPDLDDQ